jgi:DNA-binding transcriptional ArsR family regulator
MSRGPAKAVGLSMVIDGRCSALRREVGPAAWVVLEELLTGATVDGETSCAVSRTTVRGLAKETALSKDTVSRSLQRLRVAKLVHIEREQHDDSGRFVSVRYMVDMAAVPMVVSPSLDAVPSDLPSAPVALSVKSAVSSPSGRVGSGRAAQQSMFGD